MKTKLYWAYSIEWCAWWLMVGDDRGERRGYGPFTPTEAVWAGEVHGVPFTGQPN